MQLRATHATNKQTLVPEKTHNLLFLLYVYLLYRMSLSAPQSGALRRLAFRDGPTPTPSHFDITLSIQSHSMVVWNSPMQTPKPNQQQPRQIFADQAIVILVVLPASLMPFFHFCILPTITDFKYVTQWELRGVWDQSECDGQIVPITHGEWWTLQHIYGGSTPQPNCPHGWSRLFSFCTVVLYTLHSINTRTMFSSKTFSFEYSSSATVLTEHCVSSYHISCTRAMGMGWELKRLEHLHILFMHIAQLHMQLK